MIQHIGKSVVPGTRHADVIVTRFLSMGYYLRSRKFLLLEASMRERGLITSRARCKRPDASCRFSSRHYRTARSALARYLAAKLICFTGSTLKKVRGCAARLCQ